MNSLKLSLGCLAIAAISATYSHAQQASPPGYWRTVTGHVLNPFPGKPGKLAVLFFVLTDCPISNGYAPEINHIISLYRPKGVTFYLVYEDPGIAPSQAERHLKEYGYSNPAILDPTHSLARRVHATVTPEAVLLGAADSLLYRGRIDDLMVDYGKARYKVQRHDLMLALDAVVAGKRVQLSRTTSIGCVIPQ
jgi:hypothetical protein